MNWVSEENHYITNYINDYAKMKFMLFFQASNRMNRIKSWFDLKNPEVGTHWILCGVETDSKENINEYKKGIKTQDAYQAMKIMSQNDYFFPSDVCNAAAPKRILYESIERSPRHTASILPHDIAI